MYFVHYIPLLISVQLIFVSCSPSQLPLNALPTQKSTTLIDALNADPDYTSLLTLLQRARLIPIINKLNESTLFAPTNDAIERHSLWSAALNDSLLANRDNVQERLRQELFYHLLNYSISALPDEHNLQVHKTLHYPRKNVDPPTREPPPNMPIPGGTLGGEPQRIRVASIGGDVKIGTNAFAQGGAKVVKGQVDGGNGVLFGIGDVLDVPADLAIIASQQRSLSYFNRIVTPEIFSLLNSTSELTLFLPVDNAWDALASIERKYLESKFATDDILKILNMHAVVTEGVHWSESFQPALNLTTMSGSTLEIVTSPESHKVLVSTAELVEPDIYASNGVLHTVSSLLIPPGAFSITPEKYLLTLNCTSFVSMLHSVDLTFLINSTDAQYTILAPTDEVLELFGGDKDGFPEEGSEELKRVLSYHFLPGKWTPEKLKDGMFLETALEEVGLGGGRQLLDIAVSGEDGKHKKERSISFGGASVMDKYHVNNTLIYLISKPLIPPADSLETALPSLELSTFLAAVHSAALAKKVRDTPRTTFLIPENDGFKRLGILVSKHLLSASSKSDLSAVILHHIVEGVEYASALQNGSQKSYPTLEGSDVHVHRDGNGTVTVSASGGWEGMSASVSLRNMLTKTGVIHEVSDVLLPRSFNLTIGKLARAATASTMSTMLVRAGMEWVLNGTAPPEDSPWADVGLSAAGWTLLCPTDDAFKGYNLTRLYEDPTRLQAIIGQHLIPLSKPHTLLLAQLDSFQANRPLLLDDAATYTTLASMGSAYGDIVFRQSGEDEKGDPLYLVGIKNAKGTNGEKDWARVLSWGRTTTNGGVGGVIQIDSVLMPYQPTWWLEYGAPIGVGGIGIALIGLFFLGVRTLWRRDTTEATYEPVGGFSNNDDDEEG